MTSFILPSETTQLSNQVRIKIVSELYKKISKVFQKVLLKYFDDTTIFPFVIPALLLLSKNHDAKIYDPESFTVLTGSFLQNWHKLLNLFWIIITIF